ncbi:MAG TPA: polysaccharide biosynthesis tyrosine autokinase [Armatimonadota bacterium]
MALQDLPNLQQTNVPMSDNSPYENNQEDTINFGELLNVFYRRRWMLLIGLLIVFGLGMLYTFLKKPIYESTCSILVTSNKSSKSNDLPLLDDLQALTQGRSVDTQVEILSSPDLLDEAYSEKFSASLMTPEDRVFGFKSTTLPGWAVKVATKKNTDIINITVQSYTPIGAAHLANTIAQTYLYQDLSQNRQATKQAREFVEMRLAGAQKDFDAANRALAEFKRKTGLIAPEAQIGRLAENIATLQMALDTANADVKANRQSLISLRRQFSAMPEDVISGTSITQDPRVAACLQQLGTLNSERARLLQEYTAKAPEVKTVDAQIDAEESTLLKLAKNTIIAGQSRTPHPIRQALLQSFATGLATDAASNSRVQALSAEIASRKGELKELPAEERQLTELMMALDLQKSMVDMLTQKFQTLQISEESTLSNVRVVSQARPSTTPVSPKKNTNIALFLLLGVISGVGLALLVERLDDRIHDQEVAEKLTGLVTMGTVHYLDEDEAKIITTEEKHSQLLERFRVLRNNISFSTLERKIRLLAVTSAGPGEGKSTCCTNLGIVMALDGKRVLIVDCDMHRPSIHTLLKAPRNIGFTNVVMGATPLEEAIVPTEYPNLDFLPAGTLPPNPSEVLNAQPSRRLFEELAGRYDLVILDCPPCLKLSDVQIISTIVDGVILLVCAEKTLKGGLVFAHRSLSQVSAPLIGLVMNRVDMRQHGYGYYRYYSKYGYYGYYYQYSDYQYDNYGSDEQTAKGKPRKPSRRRSSTTGGNSAK